MISVQQLWKCFPQGKELFGGLGFEISSGSCWGLLGANGSGKSTLMKLLAGIYQPDTGSISIQGKVAAVLELGVAFDEELSALQNIELQGVLMGIPRQQLMRKRRDILSFADLEDFASMSLKHFSSGMKSRLAFAILREVKADVYLFDEIMAVGDEAFREKCLQTFRQWKSEGKTLLMASHDEAFMRDFCDELLCLEGGV